MCVNLDLKLAQSAPRPLGNVTTNGLLNCLGGGGVPVPARVCDAVKGICETPARAHFGSEFFTQGSRFSRSDHVSNSCSISGRREPTARTPPANGWLKIFTCLQAIIVILLFYTS